MTRGAEKKREGWMWGRLASGCRPSSIFGDKQVQWTRRFSIWFCGNPKNAEARFRGEGSEGLPVVLEVILFSELRLARKGGRFSSSRHAIASKSLVIEVETREMDDVVYCLSKVRRRYPAVHRYLCKSWQKFDRLTIRCIRKSRQVFRYPLPLSLCHVSISH